jgi:hypothetical protein
MPPMDDPRRLEAKGLARAKIRAKRRRVSSIRRRTIRGSLALFAIAWAIVFGQLVTGNDPVLSRSYATARKLVASRHHGKPAPSTPVQPEEEVPAVSDEPEPAPQAEPEAVPESEPEPVITSAS